MRRLENPSSQSITPTTTLAVILAVLGTLGGIYALRVEMRQITVADEAAYWPAKRFARLRLTGPRAFTGVLTEKGRITVESVTNGAWKTSEIETGLTDTGPVRVGERGASVAWRSGESLAVWDPAGTSAPRQIPVEAAAFEYLGGSLAVVTKEGNLEWWNPETGAREGSVPLAKGAASAAMSQGRVAVIDGSQTRMLIYSRGLARSTSLIEEARPLLAPNRLAAAGSDVVFLANKSIVAWSDVHSLPGRPTSVAAGLRGELLAAGEFDGVWSLMRGKDPEYLFPARVGSVLDTWGGQMVIAGPGGTRLYDIASVLKLSRRGKGLLWLSGVALFAAIMLAFNRQLMNLITWLLDRQGVGAPVRYGKETLISAPPEFIDLFARGEVALWTGSGLGAQAGLPTRAEFVKMLLETAYYEEWAEPNEITKLLVLAGDGKREEAVDRLIRMLGNRKHVVFEQMRCHYGRAVKTPPVYESIARLPFTAAVTGNYDDLLGEAHRSWPAGALRVNLFGTASTPERILYTRGEMKAALDEFPAAKDKVKDLFATHRIVFAGCSIPELHADLLALGIPRVQPGVLVSRHLCLAAGSVKWERQAKELHEWWGIQVDQCAEEYLPNQVRVWFANLVRAMGRDTKPEGFMAATAGR